MWCSTHNSRFFVTAQNSLFNWLRLCLNIRIWQLSKTAIELIRVSIIKTTDTLFVIIEPIFDLMNLRVIFVSAETSPRSNSKCWILRLVATLGKLLFLLINPRLTSYYWRMLSVFRLWIVGFLWFTIIFKHWDLSPYIWNFALG